MKYKLCFVTAAAAMVLLGSSVSSSLLTWPVGLVILWLQLSMILLYGLVVGCCCGDSP